jgi:hypothetical protein
VNAARWKYIKALQPPPPRLVWDSAKLGTFCENRSARKQANRENRGRGL